MNGDEGQGGDGWWIQGNVLLGDHDVSLAYMFSDNITSLIHATIRRILL